MEISVSKAKGRLTELVRLAEAGREVLLTRHGQAKAKLIAVNQVIGVEARREVISQVMESTRHKITQEVSAAHSQDFLYDIDGLPK